MIVTCNNCSSKYNGDETKFCPACGRDQDGNKNMEKMNTATPEDQSLRSHLKLIRVEQNYKLSHSRKRKRGY